MRESDRNYKFPINYPRITYPEEQEKVFQVKGVEILDADFKAVS
jgi:hypothetical protein